MLNARRMQVTLAAMVAATMMMVCASGASAMSRVDGKAGWRSGRAQATAMLRRAPVADRAALASVVAKGKATLDDLMNGIGKWYDGAHLPAPMPSRLPVND